MTFDKKVRNCVIALLCGLGMFVGGTFANQAQAADCCNRIETALNLECRRGYPHTYPHYRPYVPYRPADDRPYTPAPYVPYRPYVPDNYYPYNPQPYNPQPYYPQPYNPEPYRPYVPYVPAGTIDPPVVQPTVPFAPYYPGTCR